MGDIGGLNTGWDNTTPAAGDNSGLGDDHFRSIKTSLQEILDTEHDFTTTGGTLTGMHRHGSALPYVGPQSSVSSADTLGRLFLTSDTSRLFALGDASSRGTIYLGGVNSVENTARHHDVDGTTNDTGARNLIWAQESGLENIINGGASITFDTAYGAIPHVVSSVWTEGGTPSGARPTTIFTALSKTGFTTLTTYVDSADAHSVGARNSLGTLMWQSLGTRAV